MKIIFQTGRYLLTLLVLIAFTLPLQAQNVVENESKQTIIEIKDGKVYLNGEEVAELDDPDSSVLFKREDKEIIEKMIWMSNDEEFKKPRSRAFRFRDNGNKEFIIEGKANADGFMNRRSNENLEFFDDDDFKRVFELSARAEASAAENMGRRMARFEMAAPLMDTSERAWGSEVMELEQQSRELARKIRQTDGDDTELESELSAVLTKIFDAKLEAQQARVDKLREQLTDMEEKLGQRQGDRSEIIEKRRNELLGKGSRYEW
ncbi:MAG: hypothetical protein O2797_00540 [Bacteroidetes bacterium]|nr:hypothetical protein [Bacteroidota bacterium]MDA1332687.1 hypothetical protein [Bacteroidota bacterium]